MLWGIVDWAWAEPSNVLLWRHKDVDQLSLIGHHKANTDWQTQPKYHERQRLRGCFTMGPWTYFLWNIAWVCTTLLHTRSSTILMIACKVRCDPTLLGVNWCSRSLLESPQNQLRRVQDNKTLIALSTLEYCQAHWYHSTWIYYQTWSTRNSISSPILYWLGVHMHGVISMSLPHCSSVFVSLTWLGKLLYQDVADPILSHRDWFPCSLWSR